MAVKRGPIRAVCVSANVHLPPPMECGRCTNKYLGVVASSPGMPMLEDRRMQMLLASRGRLVGHDRLDDFTGQPTLFTIRETLSR